ncbi:acetylglucosaminyldiphospho-UDP acetyl-beta-D-mannosaminyltransferase [Ardenticatena maritima]|nr:acetylglucosaminyldiphospho-UDP acetyl-beta-D-mannosaminyltransferase [Ardenticatena maritima]
MSVEKIAVLGVPIANVTEDETVALMAQMIATRQPHHVVTVNPEFLMEARRNPAFRRVLLNADLAIPDGIGVVLAGRLQGRPFRARVAGSDLVERLAAESARRGWRLYFLGAAPGVAEQAIARLQARYPTFRAAGAYAGSPTPEETPDLIARVRAAQPDVLFVAYGHPRQDLWIAANKDALGVPVMMGVGGAFDFLAGVVPRAPVRMRQMGLEWLYRLYKQPWRWRRMLALPQFLMLALFEAIRLRKERHV